MPSRFDNGSGTSRFELPALNLNFGSITDGTDIPPPPKSPVEKPAEKVPEKTVEKPSQPQAPKETTPAQNSVATTAAPATNGNLAGTKRPAEDIPPSPTASNRPGSLRRLLSRTLLNNSYAEGQLSVNGDGAASVVNGSRPASRSGGSFMDERKSKRSSGWFRRLRGGDSKRSSLIFDQQPPTPTTPTMNKPSGPPPPMIPELKDLEKDEGSLGNDLFKNIK